MPNPKFRGIAELTTSTVLTILLAISAAVVLGFGAMWTHGEMQKADSMRIQALIQGQAVLDGDVFAVQFSQPVVVEQIGYGWYDGRTGQEVGVQFRNVGSSGKYFSWRLDRADYNLTYVIAKDPNSDVRKIFRWRFVKLSPETQAAMAAQFSDVFANQYANQYAQQYAYQYAQQYAQQIQQQLQSYIDQAIQQQLGPDVRITQTQSYPSPPTSATITRTREIWWSNPPPEYPTTTAFIVVDRPPYTWPTFTTTTYVQPPTTVTTTRDLTIIEPTWIEPPKLTLPTTSRFTSASTFVSGRTNVKPEPQPTTPDSGSGGGSNNNNDSPPWDWCIECTGTANDNGYTVQRGDEAYGQPGNFENVPNTVSVEPDGTVVKTYDNGDVHVSNSGSSGSSDTSGSSSSSESSSGGGTNQISGVAGNCVDNLCPI